MGVVLLLLLLLALAGSQDDAIVWSAERPLTWQDFKAKAPGGFAGARGVINHQFGVGCRDRKLEYRVQPVFIPSQSWVTYEIMTSGLGSRVGLQHEQIHFDLAEVYARRMRKMFSELKDPCPRSDQELGAMADRLLRDQTAAQGRFDQETQNGELQAKQLEWFRNVAKDLASLAQYK